MRAVHGKPGIRGRAMRSERLPPSAMRTRRWASRPRRPRSARPLPPPLSPFSYADLAAGESIRIDLGSGLGVTPGRKEGSDSTSSSGFHIEGHDAKLLGRSTSSPVTRLFEGWTGHPLGRLALTDRPVPPARILFRRRSIWRVTAAPACAVRHPLYCAIHTVRAVGASHGASPPLAARISGSGFSARPPRRSRCTWCARAIQRAASWASLDVNGSVHVLGGVLVESGREGEGPAGTSPVGCASPTLGKPSFGWASTARDGGSLHWKPGR